MLLSFLVVGLIRHTAISDGLIVSFNLGLLSDVLLDQCKSVHGLFLRVWIFRSVPSVVCVSLIWEMNESVPPRTCNPNGSNVSVVTNQLYLL